MATMVKCKACGAEVSEKMNFCGTCGSAVERNEAVSKPAEGEVPTEAPKTAEIEVLAANEKKAPGFSLQKWIKPAIAAGAVLAVLIVIAAVGFLRPAQYGQGKGSVHISGTYDGVIIFPNGKGRVEVEGNFSDRQFSLDGARAAVLIDQGGEGAALYHVTDNLERIADEVVDFWLSADGKAISYTKEYDYDAQTAELWLYAGGKSTFISNECSVSHACAISPRGDTVGYVDYNGDDYRGFLWKGKSRELGKGIFPAAVADSGKYVYFFKNDAFYVQKGTNSDRREKLGEGVESFMANRNLSQILFSIGAKGYISKNGGKKEALSGVPRYMVIPEGTAVKHTQEYYNLYSISDFAGTFYQNDDGTIVHIDKKYETNTVAKNVRGAFLSQDGKTLLYSRNGDGIYKVDGTADHAEAEMLVEDEIKFFIATADGKTIFFGNEDDELYRQKGKGKPVSVSRDFVYNPWRVDLFQGRTLFYISDDELYVSTGAKGKVVGGFTGEPRNIYADWFSIMVTTEDDGEILYYRSTDGRQFDLIKRD